MYQYDSISIDSYEWPLRSHFIRVTYIYAKNAKYGTYFISVLFLPRII